ncbi:Gfo/Idh/MocA family oxidoreductase [Streptomyces sp. MI02-7b]|uniref:Gfo/Idh/MocA family protein n=1 Tax=Streptomyces sp. MI02-7b TaxID=462941 RepID=UPI0029AE917E|nr:Gfo/Idh/MocA family oxidoreductase [Streptomyces sp. MI02-7b]MDX3078379.1 Gfo/Idh/MocA family oxidoreductase [Streptomyces sp. MI02-7b]
MTGRRLRVGVVGLGKIAQLHHLPNLDASPDFELAAVCDRSAVLTATIAARYHLPASATTTDHHELVHRDLDAIVVANRHHAPVVLAALAAGRHVFVEKPLCWGLDEAERIREAVRSSGRTLVVGYMKRYDPAAEQLLGAMPPAIRYGRVHNFAGGRHRVERLHPVAKPTDLGPRDAEAEDVEINTVAARHLGTDDPARIAAFRAVSELASHDVNLVRTALGGLEVEWARVSGPDTARDYLALFRAGDAPVWLEMCPEFGTARDWDEEIAFFGAHGGVGLRFDSPFRREAATTRWHDGIDGTDLVRRASIASFVSPFRRELEHFHHCVVTGESPRTGVDDSVADLLLLRDLATRMELS